MLVVIDEIKNAFISEIQGSLFLTKCRNGEISLDFLKKFLVQQGIYGQYFTRYLCATMSNLDNNNDVMDLAHNLFEELGFESNSQPPHYILYREMLNYFDLNLNSSKENKETRDLIKEMFYYCRNPDPAYGLSALCLGAEALVPYIYSDIIKGFEAHGYDRSLIEFFHLHVECDDGHAETLSNMMSKLLEYNPSNKSKIIESGKALVVARKKFLDGILSN